MSSSDNLDPSGETRCGPRGFQPLCPVGGTAEPFDASWRPLFGDGEHGEDLVGEGWLPIDGRSGPESQGQPDVRGGEGDAAGEENARAFAAAHELGRQEARAELESVAESLVKSVEELASFRLLLCQRYERELLELALGVARKVLHAEIRGEPERWLGMIREGIRKAVDHEEVRIRVPAVLATFLAEHLPEMRAQLDGMRDLVVVEDPGLQEGGCVIETRFGEFDLGIDTQVDHVERELTRVG
jgi:Flagellar assembly protein FliH